MSILLILKALERSNTMQPEDRKNVQDHDSLDDL
jgi:hypothetical protein